MNDKFSRIIIIYICVILCCTGAFFLYRSRNHNMISVDKNNVTTKQILSNENESEKTDAVLTNNLSQEESEFYIPRFYVRGFFEIKDFLDEKMEDGMINDYSYIVGEYSAYVTVTDDQKQQWIKYSQDEIDRLLAKEYDGFTIEVGDDNTSLNMYVQSDSDYYLATHTMQDVIFNIQNYLVFSEVKDWSCHVVIKNVDSGKDIMNMYYPNENGDINKCDWTNIEDEVLAYETITNNSYSYIHYEEPVIIDDVYISKAAGISIIIPNGAKVSTQEELDEFNGLNTQDEYFNRLFEIKKTISFKVYEDFMMVLDNGITVNVGIQSPVKDNEADSLSWMEKNLEETLKDEPSVVEYDISRVQLLGRECILHKTTDSDGKRYEYSYYRDGMQVAILIKYKTAEQEQAVIDFVENNIIRED